jgi:TusA-related sulfurtransferase
VQLEGTDDESSAGLIVDSRGLLCPAPIIELARVVRGRPDGTVVTLLADDPAAAIDVPAWCRLRGHDYLGSEPIDVALPSIGAPQPGVAPERGVAPEPGVASSAYRVRVAAKN